MNVKELIDAAVNTSGTPQTELAEEMGIAPARISEMKSGKRKPDVNELAFFADKAQLSVLETIAQIEKDLNPSYAQMWDKAITQLRQNKGLSQLLRRFRRKSLAADSGLFFRRATDPVLSGFRRRVDDPG